MSETTNNLKTVELDIDGMSCSACSAAVERVTKKLPGMVSAGVNLATNRGVFEYDPSLVKLTEIKAAIEKAGYVPRDAHSETRDEEEEKRDKTLRIMRIRLIIAVPQTRCTSARVHEFP
jgi:P-type Cu+ transporter